MPDGRTPVTRDALITYLRDEIRVDTAAIEDDTPLFTSSRVDSFAMIEVITFLEREGGFRIPPADVTLTNLDTVDAMLGYCARRATS